MGRESALKRNDFPNALLSFKRATELDPNFASAHSSLGVMYHNLGQEDLAVQSLTRAYELRDRVTENERLGIETMYYMDVTGNLQKARETFDLRLQVNPRDWTALINSVGLYLGIGQYQRALERSQEALKLSPERKANYDRLCSSYLMLNRLPDAKAVGTEAESKNLDSPALHFWMYQLAFVERDSMAMAGQVAWGESNQEVASLLVSGEAATASYGGQLKKGRELTRHTAELANRVDQKGRAGAYTVWFSLGDALVGASREAEQLATIATTISSDRDVQCKAALSYAVLKDSNRSAKLVAEMDTRFPEDTLLQFVCLPEVRAQLALNQNDYTRAVETLKLTVPYEMGGDARLFPTYLRGQAYLGAHHGLEAIDEFRKILDHREIVQNGIIGALAHLQLGRAYSMQGDTAKAKAAYQDFLTLWKDADPDIPIFIAAKAEYAKLK